MRILRHPVPRLRDVAVDPAQLYRRLYRDAPDAFWLDAGGGTSFLGAGSRTITGPGVLDRLAEQLDPAARPGGTSGRSVPLGWVGWLGYGLARYTTEVDVAVESQHPSSVAALMRVDRLVSVNEDSGEVELLALGEAWDGDLRAWRAETLAVLESLEPAREDSSASDRGRRAAVWADTDPEYLEHIAACQRAIRDGEAYQLCLTTEARIEGRFDALDTYRALRATSPTGRGGLIRSGDRWLLSASPEQFLAVSADGTVETKPIKGTRPRGTTPERDTALADELLADPKERAENLMIVDLMRNDLGRVCEIGSVSVPSLFEVQSYPQVHQLVSAVSGRLRAGCTPIDAVRSCFPAGSMTGAPKLRAIELLDRIEARPRGVYAGAFGWFAADGSVSLSMVIRSILLTTDAATIGAGGGITSSSVPERELAEVKLKARALLDVLGAT